MARDLAGSDPEAQARVRLVEDRSFLSAGAGGDGSRGSEMRVAPRLIPSGAQP